MRIGITFDLKTERTAEDARRAGFPDDFQEEFDSPATIDAIMEVLRGLGHDVIPLGDGRDFLERILTDPPDFVFNFAEGQGISRSREARVPAVLEMLDIPYTGSDPLTLAVTLDKDCAKRLVASAGLAVPQSTLIPGGDIENGPLPIVHCPFPVIVKPAWEGSSKGIRTKCLVQTPDELPEVVATLQRDQRQPILVEEYIDGDELTVGMLGNNPPKILGVMRVVPRQPTLHFVYSLEIKRDFRRLVEYQCPAPMPTAIMKRVREAAMTVFEILGCRDVARIDFRLKNGIPYFLEINPLPGLHPDDSDLVIMAKLVGWDHAQLVEKILTVAMDRHSMNRDQGAGIRGQERRESSFMLTPDP